MANLPRFGRAWPRHSTVAHPAPAAAQPASEPKLEILPLAPTTQPFEPNPLPLASPPRESTPWISSPAKKVPSPAASPKFKATVTNVASPPVNLVRSPPASHSINPNSYQKTPKPTTPPLSPLAVPKSANVTTTQSRIQPEVEKKTGPYKKSAEKLDRQTEYGFGKLTQTQQREAINLTGDNVGAVMEVSQLSDKRSGGEFIKKIETEMDVRHGNDEEGKTGAKEKSQRATGLPMTPFMNSNFQDVNNSIMYNSSCSGRDPGLHLDFSGKSKDDGAMVDDGEKSKY